MLLTHLLPFLDAEIDRLQRARDLLAYVPSPVTTGTPESHELNATGSLAATVVDDLQLTPELALQPVVPGPRVVVLKPHGLSRGWRHAKRRAMPQADTALRSSVPAGPVVVSAEDARRAQAPKAAARAAADAPSAFTWHSPSHDTRDVSALLQKLMDLGKQEEGKQSALSPV